VVRRSPTWKRCSAMPSLTLPAKIDEKILTPITDFNRSGTDEEVDEEDFGTQGYHCWAHHRCDLLAGSVGTNLKVNSIRALPCCFCSRTS